MSAAHRKLTRLTLEIFKDLQRSTKNHDGSGPESSSSSELQAEELRAAICEKLKRFRVPSRNGGTRTVSLTTVGDILRASPLTLLQALDPLLTFAAILVLLKRICHECGARPVTCRNLLNQRSFPVDASGARYHNEGHQITLQQQQTPTSSLSSSSSSATRTIRFLPTGLESIDNMGGVRVGSITEIVGRPGVGKTQLALQLVLMATRYNQGAMYIDTERKLILGRLREMATRRWSERVTSKTSHQRAKKCNFSYGISTCYTQYTPDDNNEEGNQVSSTPDDSSSVAYKHPDQVLRNVSVKQPKSTEELLQLLEGVEEDILHRTKDDGFPVRVLIVDSIAAPLNRDFGADLVPQRAATAFSIAQTLKRYAEQLFLAVIVINQAGVESHHSGGGNEEWKNDQTNVRAALGTSWHHCVSTRILVEQINAPGDGYPTESHLGETSHRRALSVVKSNWMPHLSLNFEITPIGIVEVDSEYNEHNQPSTNSFSFEM